MSAALKPVYLETNYVEEAAGEGRREETAAIMHLAQLPPTELLTQLSPSYSQNECCYRVGRRRVVDRSSVIVASRRKEGNRLKHSDRCQQRCDVRGLLRYSHTEQGSS